MSAVITSTPLADRVAVVTGASSGIGEAAAERLAELGAKVAVRHQQQQARALLAEVGQRRVAKFVASARFSAKCYGDPYQVERDQRG